MLRASNSLILILHAAYKVPPGYQQLRNRYTIILPYIVSPCTSEAQVLETSVLYKNSADDTMWIDH